MRRISAREIRTDGGTKRNSTFIYVRPIDSLLYGARGKRRLCWTPDAEESEAAAGAAGIVARTEMDSGSKEREIRGGMLGREEGEDGRGGRVRESMMRRREGGEMKEERERWKGEAARATERTGVGYAHEGRLKREKEEDGIKRGKKRGELGS